MSGTYTPTPRVHPTITLPQNGDLVNEANVIAPVKQIFDVASIAQATYGKNYELRTLKGSGPHINAVAAGRSSGARAWVVCGSEAGTDAFIAFSRDGQSWAEQANPRHVGLHGVAYSPALDLWALVGDAMDGDAYVLTSRNGRAPFTERANPAELTLYGVCAGPSGEFVAVGDAGYIVRSSDGQSWEQQPSPVGVPLYAAHYAAGRFVACGGVATAPCVLTSTDGCAWVPRTVPALTGALRAAAHNGHYWFTLSAAGEVLRSADVTTWNQVRGDGVDSSAWARGIAADAETGLVVATGDSASGVVITLDDGASWQSVELLGAGDGVNTTTPLSVTFGHGRFAMGARGGVFALGQLR